MPFALPAIAILFIAAVLALLVALVIAPPVIRFLRAKKFGQQIRDDGPHTHLQKAGTPTMGGIIILAGLVAGSIVAWPLLPSAADRTALLLLLGLTLAVAALGSVDDWGKIKRGRSLGLRARDKLFYQTLIGALFVAGMLFGLQHDTTIGVPGVGAIDLHWAYWPVAILLLAGMSNAVNLTDGLDGLAGGTSAIAAVALAILAWRVPGLGHGVAVFAACLAAGCLGFLWFNRHPARVFMGDTGSLAIGAALAGIALLVKAELLLLLIGLVFLIEAGSVILQVIAFKTTGKRIFRMSPFHHHLELGGWKETKIVYSTWALSLLLAAIAVMLAVLL